MRLLVLDGHALNPGDLDWGPLRELGEVEIHPRTSPEEVVERAAGAEIVLTNKTPLTSEALARLPDLRYIGVLATGTNVVDLEAARERGIVVTNVPDYGTVSVAQHTIALLLELTNAVGRHARAVEAGEWAGAKEWSLRLSPMTELHGLTFGVIGLGRIGRRAAELARAFGMKPVAARRRPEHRDDEIELLDRNELFERADVVSLHCPLTPETERMIDEAALARMKPTAFLLNTARGGLIDEAALARALHGGRIAGAGLDVLGQEPPPPEHPLLNAPNLIVTPHVAWATKSARERLMREVVENVRAFLEGEPKNQVG
jgi:glycerate dehydrogenase